MSSISDKLTPRQRGLAASFIVLASIMMTLDTSIVNVALPTIQGGLGATHEQIAWILTSYLVACAIGMPLAGALAGPFGMRRLYLAAIVAFGTTSVLCGLATTLPQMVVFRALQGLSGAAFFPLSQALLLDIYPEDQHSRATEIFSAGVMMGPVLGPPLGGLITEMSNWRWVFFVNVPVAAIAFIGLLTMLPRMPRERGRSFDFLGFGLFAFALGPIQLVLDRGHAKDWLHSPEILAELIVGALAAYLFVVHTITRERTFIDRRLFQDRSFVIGLLATFIVCCMMFVSLMFLPPFLQGVQGRTVIGTGIILIPRAIGLGGASIIAGQLIRIFGIRTVIFAGTFISAVAVWIMSDTAVETSAWDIAFENFFQAFGLGLTIVPLTLITFSTIAPELRPIAASVFNLGRNVGSAIGLSIAVVVYSQSMDENVVRLSEQMNVFNPAFHAREVGHFALSDPMAVALMSKEVARQSMVISFNNVMIGQAVMLLVVFVALLFVLRLWTPPRGALAADLPPAEAVA